VSMSLSPRPERLRTTTSVAGHAGRALDEAGDGMGGFERRNDAFCA